MKRILALCLTVGATLPATHAISGEIRERTTFFMVRGKSFDDLYRELGMKGPDLGQGERHAGSTDVAFKANATYKPTTGGCGIAHAEVRLDLHTTLPRWSGPKNGSRETQILWKILRDDIATHEAEHSRIAKSWLKRIEATIRSLKPQPSCARMEALVNSETRALLKQHDDEQLAFDAAESKRIDARLERKINQQLHRVASR
ncbi:DUF922 domain-containing protein [Aureimonas sp. N4]|uniref:DUF922 domain-containing protein n=1 Tax=Aureimonas sp. N4 TaxID=1638165 RepID=UPI000784D467|nr:DUF922 domain-containing protein [Aureimonas sp. N4]